jgi:hypothetical protein
MWAAKRFEWVLVSRSTGDQVNLAMGLLERLADTVIFEPATPMENGLDIGGNRVPESGGLLSREVDFTFAGVDDATVMPETRPTIELPDQAAGHVCEQRMIEITGPKRFDGDGALGEQETLDAGTMCGEHLLHVFHRALQIAQFFRVMLLDVSRNTFQ